MTESDPSSQNLNPPPNDPQIQELTFSYLCENSSFGFQDKGKETIASSVPLLPPIERDYLQMRRETERIEIEAREKKVNIETLSFSLALNASVPSSAPNSTDLSQNVIFSHNPSCSLSRCATKNHSKWEENDDTRYAGEGTNWSVHSRFRPIGDGDTITFANPKKELNADNHDNMNANNSGGGSFYRKIRSDNTSLFPSKLPVKTGDTNVNWVFKEIVSRPVSFVAQIFNEFSKESLAALKNCLRSLMEATEKEELIGLQRRLDRRMDLTAETLSRANKAQLEILVAIKIGIAGFLSGKNRLPSSELIEIFMMTRCGNLDCKSSLPVDDCDCKFCATQKGFCSACMCLICLKFDCASNTCSWVGCDFCAHWCHALCAVEKKIIRPVLNQELGNGMKEMQFMCPGCDHPSKMFGFVKEVFTYCAKDWGLETLMKELDCVRMIFHVSEDFEEKELEKKAKEIFAKLGKKQISPGDACNAMLQFFECESRNHSSNLDSDNSISCIDQNLGCNNSI